MATTGWARAGDGVSKIRMVAGRRRGFLLGGTVLALVFTTAFWATTPALAFADDDITQEYVALGDSFAAGPLILPQEELDPCFR
ncbi:MAG TPA: hypothetical protein VH008_15795, partial [Pseudonocardia sp.]|nr:hypothetical protein [Pseudonocardia sp.]